MCADDSHLAVTQIVEFKIILLMSAILILYGDKKLFSAFILVFCAKPVIIKRAWFVVVSVVILWQLFDKPVIKRILALPVIS